jgi:hypothetical protein
MQPQRLIEAMEMPCPACGMTNLGQMTHCVACQAALASAMPRICPSCGRSNVGVQPICLFCRVALPSLSATPVVRKPAEKREPAAAVCPNCNSPLKPGKSFCTACGHRMAAGQPQAARDLRRCSKCSSEVPAGKNFCTVCGTRMT